MSTPTMSPTLDISGTAPVPFTRLVAVEWRKMLDTRSGRWLLGLTVGLLVLVCVFVLIVIAVDDGHASYYNWVFNILLTPLGILLPVFPILCITSEWSQRTGLTTFALEAHRGRLVAAKLVAVLALVAATIVFAAILGVVANLAGAAVGGYSTNWSIDGSDAFWTLFTQFAYFLMAFGLGAVLLSSPAAISVFYVFGLMLPVIVYFGLVSSFDWAATLIPFFDLQTSSAQMAGGERINGDALTGLNYAQFASAMTIWVVIPIVVGVMRIKKSEIK